MCRLASIISTRALARCWTVSLASRFLLAYSRSSTRWSAHEVFSEGCCWCTVIAPSKKRTLIAVLNFVCRAAPLFHKARPHSTRSMRWRKRLLSDASPGDTCVCEDSLSWGNGVRVLCTCLSEFSSRWRRLPLPFDQSTHLRGGG